MGNRHRAGERKKVLSDLRTAVAKGEKEFTRMKAERAVAKSFDVERLTELQSHKNKHVVAKAKYKLAHMTVVVPAEEKPEERLAAALRGEKPKTKRVKKESK